MRILALAALLFAACGGPRSTAPTTTGNTADPTIAPDAAQPVQSGQHIDGTEGAICGWGARHADPAPPPESCAAGLTCCYPCGIDGCDSVCESVPNGECPELP